MTYQSLPPEWAPQQGVILTWPHTQGDWRDIAAIEHEFVSLAKTILQYESLWVNAFDAVHQAHITKLLPTSDQLWIGIAPSNDIWVRDHGPISISRDNQVVMLDFQFNGWGNKYAHDLDNAITHTMNRQGAFPNTSIEAHTLILEGGSIEVDGRGNLLTTVSCLANPNRNPDLSTQAIEKQLQQIFGIKQVIWLTHGELIGDDTDGHIDTLARFVNEETIAYTSCDDKNDEQFPSLKKMQDELRALPYELIALPIPKPIYDNDGQRLPANYANFLIINGAVLVPQYDDPADAIAIDRLSPYFPDRNVIGLPSSALIQQFGGIHCATMQIPRFL